MELAIETLGPRFVRRHVARARARASRLAPVTRLARLARLSRLTALAIAGALLITKTAGADPMVVDRASATAHADGTPCELRFDAALVPDAWAGALADVRAVVAKLTMATTDCRTISVTPKAGGAGGASIMFTTGDGRIARRQIAEPSELLPAVQALLVILHDASQIADVEPMATAPEATEEIVPAPEPTAVDPSRNPSDSIPSHRKPGAPHLLLGAGAGVKGSWPNDSVTPVGQIYAGTSFGHWEAAGYARWEIEHDAEAEGRADAPAGKLRYSALGGGAMFGRRQPVGPLVVIGGVRAALMDAEEERTGQRSTGRAGRLSEDFLDPRVGLYAGCILSESSFVRLRVQVDGDAGVLVHRNEIAELPTFPRWNLGISLGAEAGFLP